MLPLSFEMILILAEIGIQAHVRIISLDKVKLKLLQKEMISMTLRIGRFYMNDYPSKSLNKAIDKYAYCF